MANTATSMRTHDPNGVVWNAGYTIDTGAGAVLPLLVAGTIIQPLSVAIGTVAGTSVLANMTLTTAAGIKLITLAASLGACSLPHSLKFKQMLGASIIVNSVAGAGTIIAFNFEFKYLGGTAPTVV